MFSTYAVLIEAAGQPDVCIGPFISKTNAKRFAARLREVARKRLYEASITVQTANPSRPHLEPRLPTDPWTVERLLQAERQELEGTDTEKFPDLFARLYAQIGPEAVVDVFQIADGWAGRPDTRDQLIAAAEDWRGQREDSTDALQSVAVELWRDGLENVQEIRQITGLSRTTIYAVLRGRGIDPTTRSTELLPDVERLRAGVANLQNALTGNDLSADQRARVERALPRLEAEIADVLAIQNSVATEQGA
ncbi:hypothetical protein [Streptomyces sp. NPDC088733]|uniref:hypothetical protein n=1 Tax=Streptomyces sp. NPDC088733 TaxID=3365880 RepID=UPI003816DFD3